MPTPGDISSDRLLARLSREQRRWLWINALAVPTALNASISAAIAWLTSRGELKVPLWSTPLIGGPALLTDTLGTLFVLPLITSIALALSVRAALRNGQLQRLTLPQRWVSLVDRLPTELVPSAVRLAATMLLLLGPFAIAILTLTDLRHGISPLTFVVYKAVLGVGLGVIVTPLVAVLAMARTPET